MAQNEEKTVDLPAKLCIKCMEMYGHPNFDEMCSACFRKQKAEDKVEAFKKIEQQLLKTPEKEPEVEVEEEASKSVSKKRTLPCQEVKIVGRCGKCSKKTSIYGINCKHCNNEFCKYHRLPQDHDCGIDFISLGRKQLKMDNPLVAKKKVEQI